MIILTFLLIAGMMNPVSIPGTEYGQDEDRMAPVIQKVQSSVVSIQTYGRDDRDSWCRVGTGFVFHPNGFIVTYASVVAGGDSISVKFTDGRRKMALIAGEDEQSKIVLLKLNSESLTPLSVPRAYSLKTGTSLFFIGNSVGVFPSVTLATLMRKDQDGLMRLKAMVPPGNCGGPVFTSLGRLAGMVIGRLSGKKSTVEEIDRQCIFLPIQTVERSGNMLISEYRRREGWLGITAVDVPVEDDGTAVKVIGLVPGGPAHQARIFQGDTIVGLGGQPVTDVSTLAEKIKEFRPDQTVEIRIKRGDSLISKPVQLGGIPFRKKSPAQDE